MKNSVKISLLVVLTCAILLMSGCTGSTNTHTATIDGKEYTFNVLNNGELKVASEAGYPPFEMINTTTNEFEGFDVDIMNEIGKELGLKVVYVDQPFVAIIAAVQAKQFDCAISAFTITGKRQEMVDFSDWYYENAGQYIVVKPENTEIKGAADLIGKKVGVQEGTVGRDAVKGIEGFDENDLMAYQKMSEALMALKKGDVVAVVGDKPVCDPYVENYPGDYMFVESQIGEVEHFGIVVNKENKDLTNAINAALAKIKADGRWQAAYDKWFVTPSE